MKKIAHLTVAFFCFTQVLQAKVTTEKTTVLFHTDKYELTNESVNQLTDFIHQHLKTNDYEIKIEGHTDNIGDIAYNKKLSQNRAEEVRQFLINLGAKQKLININYLGELSPEKPNINDVYRGKNRRVVVTLIRYQFDDVSELEEALNPDKTSIHVINPTQENIIIGNKGVKILIEPKTFVYENGTTVNEDISFELTESLAFKDFVSSGLRTQTANDLLETDGMIKVAAKTVSGKPVKIKQENPMLIAIPTENRQDNMEVFVSDVGSEWEAKNQPITVANASDVYKTYYKTEDYPVFKNTNNVKLPKYLFDVSDKPVKPNYPRFTKAPKEPREDGYLRPIPWFRFNKDKIKEKQQSYYQAALDKYYTRLEKYELKHKTYEEAASKYTLDVKDYECKLEFWKAREDYRREEFQQSEAYQSVLKKHNLIYEANLARHKKAVEEWRSRRKDQMTAMGNKMDKLGVTDEKALNNYVFAFNELKWINVDRFYHLKEDQKQLVTMKGEDVGDERVLILFKNIESMLPMHLNEEKADYRQYNFPIGEAAVIFAYKVKDGKPYLCYREIDGSVDYTLDYIETSFFEIKEILSQFDGPKKS